MSRTIETTRLSSKGQIVVPKSIRDEREWLAGTEFVVEHAKEGILLRPLRPFPRTELKDVAGSLSYHGKRKTLKDMDKAVGAMVRNRHARGRY